MGCDSTTDLLGWKCCGIYRRIAVSALFHSKQCHSIVINCPLVVRLTFTPVVGEVFGGGLLQAIDLQLIHMEGEGGLVTARTVGFAERHGERLGRIIHQVPFNPVFYEIDRSILTHLENRLSSTVGIPLLFVWGSINVLPCLWSGRVSVVMSAY